MTIGVPRTSFRERPNSRSKLYWLDIDVTFNDITRQQQMISSRVTVRRPPSALQYSVLHGVGTVANALSVGDAAITFDRFQVDVAALVQTEDNFGLRNTPVGQDDLERSRCSFAAAGNLRANENAAPFGGAVRDKTDRCNHNVNENCG